MANAATALYIAFCLLPALRFLSYDNRPMSILRTLVILIQLRHVCSFCNSQILNINRQKYNTSSVHVSPSYRT